ncbi:hypothetical protein SDC9_201480 [bioreactor metagenome]|uniref:Uncharacterized protein n=1 Tax=bioreactor metagenome TaxID=1076179 RepID=A0A645IZZ3_9ZZZZ
MPAAQDADQQKPVHFVVAEQDAVKLGENPVGVVPRRQQLLRRDQFSLAHGMFRSPFGLK